MVRPLRLEAEGAVYHVIVRGNERKAVFRDDRDRERYLEGLARYRERFGFRILAYCLMDNHVHLALERGPVMLSRIMLSVQGSYTQWFNFRHGRVGHLFQGRYKALLVQRDRYLLALVRYIHENPVGARLVERASEYRWSSDRAYRRGSGPEWLDLDRVLPMFGRNRQRAATGYRKFMGEELEEPYGWVKEISQAIKGDEDFAIGVLRRAGERPMSKTGLKPEQVAAAVAREHGVKLEELMTPSRRRELSRVRIEAAYLGRREAGIPVAQTARFFEREESTLNRGVLKLESEIARSKVVARHLDRHAKRFV